MTDDLCLCYIYVITSHNERIRHVEINRTGFPPLSITVTSGILDLPQCQEANMKSILMPIFIFSCNLSWEFVTCFCWTYLSSKIHKSNDASPIPLLKLKQVLA